MPRQTNKMQIEEALFIFEFESEDEITKEIIMKKFRELSFKHHPDKNPKADVKLFTKVVEAKEVLLRDFDVIATTSNGKNKSIKSVGSVFVDWVKVADTKNIKNPFTIYQQGKSKGKRK